MTLFVMANPWRAGALATAALAAGLLAWGLVLDAARADGKRAAEAVRRLVGEIDGYMAAADAAAVAGRRREKEASGAAQAARQHAALPKSTTSALRQIINERPGATICETDRRIYDAIDVLRAAG